MRHLIHFFFHLPKVFLLFLSTHTVSELPFKRDSPQQTPFKDETGLCFLTYPHFKMYIQISISLAINVFVCQISFTHLFFEYHCVSIHSDYNHKIQRFMGILFCKSLQCKLVRECACGEVKRQAFEFKW